MAGSDDTSYEGCKDGSDDYDSSCDDYDCVLPFRDFIISSHCKLHFATFGLAYRRQLHIIVLPVIL